MVKVIQPEVGLIIEAQTENRRAHRLGRHVCFDERSRKFPMKLPKRAPIVSKLWTRNLLPLQQGELGMCTGAACIGVLATDPHINKRRKYDLPLALKVYKEATKIDVIKGYYPPEDTGSTVLAAMKAAVKLGLCKGYTWCFGLQDVLRTLSNVGPVEVGTSWHSGFDHPDLETGMVKLTGPVEGGHAYQLIGVDAEKKTVWAVNSWGSAWGKSGRFCLSWDDLDKLLKDDGEAVAPVTK